MLKKITLLVSFLLLNSALFAQTYEISGSIQDSMNVRPIVFASVSLLQKSDSVLKSFTRTNQQGKFSFSGIKPNDYILLVAHNTYVDYVDEIKVTEKNVAVEKINLFQRGQLLREVVVKNAAGIKIKGDTLEYFVDSFKSRDGAMVEDLLKVLPGIQVNKKGEITAMGEKVEKVLVDGEEFFGDDPTVATQNIQSKIVEKVQVFEQKSDQAKFTGFADGQEQKTINLKLKDGMNKGEFGKVELAGGLDDRWQNQIMVNSFKNKRQFSVYGVMSSLGKTGLGWDDRRTYTGAGSNMQMDEDNNFIWYSGNDDDDNWGGVREGITKAWTGGVHFADKWNENKQQINTNYSFGRINTVKRENSITENLLPNFSYETTDTSDSYSSRNTHRLTTRYEYNIDSSTTIIYNLNSRLGFTESTTSNKTFNQNYDDSPISSSVRNNNSNATTARINNQLTLNRKLNKIGRTISLNANFNYTKNEGNGLLNGNNVFDNNGVPINDLLDQEKDQEQITNYLNADLTYTEPLSKKVLLKAMYSFTSDNSHSSKSTLIKENGNSAYNKQIDSLSSDFNSVINSHTGGLEFKYTQKKHTLSVGSRVRYSIFNQEDLVRNLNYDYNRINVFPTLRYNYKINQFSRLSFTYNGSTRQPSITQIQPVQDNSNPLQIYVGNPNLKIGYSQTFNVNFFNYKVMTSRSIYTGLNFTNNYNAISINKLFDELGRTINKYVNLSGAYNASLWAGINTKIPKTPLEAKLNLSGNYGFTPNIINDVEGKTSNYSLTFTPGLAYNVDDKIYSSINLGTIYTNATNSLQSNRNIQFISFNPTADINYILPKNFEIGSDVDFLYNPAVAPYKTSFSRFLWNGNVSYKMLKNKNLLWKVSINDIFNQNTGYERTTTNNYNTERNFLTLGRYWLVGMVWTFNNGPMANTAASGGKGMPKMRGGRPRTSGPRGGGGRR